MSNITNLATTTALNAKINEVKNKIPNNSNLATNTALTAVENKMPGHSKYITTTKFNKLRAENFTARLKQGNLATKDNIADFVKKKREILIINKNIFIKKLPQINQNIY